MAKSRNLEKELAVLVPTCERYRNVGAITGRLVDKFWRGHPPVWYCGLANDARDDVLALKRDSKDWIGIAYDACLDLESMGVKQVFLILDDHPPIARCNAEVLNTTLPRLLRSMEAACISLNGWERGGRDGREPVGEILDRTRECLEKLPEDHRWRYNLHPALWDISSLISLLRAFVESCPVGQRSPWVFERRATALAKGNISGDVYRVCGRKSTISRTRWIVHFLRKLTLRLRRRYAVGKDSDEAFNDSVQYYEGPYPIYWSGIVTAGAMNQSFIRFLRASGRSRLAAEIERIVAPEFG